jgi:NAD(P)-dependent dehydrogenase (short-subunit alcohol dehydrogenase family)
VRLQGRSVLITGGSLGIGKTVASACVQEGADILLCARNGDTLERTRAELLQHASSGQKIYAVPADVGDQKSARQLVETAIAELPNLTGVVNAAAINGPKGRLEDTSIDDWLSTIQVNLIGTMLVCRYVLPHFRSRNYGKIINFSGGGATSPHPRFTAYACSKVAIVRLTETLAHEVDGSGIDVNAVAPGAVNTRMLQEVLDAGPGKVGQASYDRALKQSKEGGAPPEKAASLCVSLLSSECDGISGKLISAVWDAWETLPDRRSDLMKSDVYTLRRILPEDRGMDWA